MDRLTDKNATFDVEETKKMFKQRDEFIISMGKKENRLKELEDLQERIGCPLEVRCKVYYNSIIYNCLGYKMTVKETYGDHFLAALENNVFIFDYRSYMQEWFLKEDKSE